MRIYPGNTLLYTAFTYCADFELDTPLPAYSGDDEFVFVCYSHQDLTQVYEEITSLNELGVNVWYDEGIRPGAEWTDEIQYAIANDVPILVIYLEDTELPPGLALSLGSVQAVLKQRYDRVRCHSMVVDAIKADTAILRQPASAARSGADRGHGAGQDNVCNLAVVYTSIISSAHRQQQPCSFSGAATL